MRFQLTRVSKDQEPVLGALIIDKNHIMKYWDLLWGHLFMDTPNYVNQFRIESVGLSLYGTALIIKTPTERTPNPWKQPSDTKPRGSSSFSFTLILRMAGSTCAASRASTTGLLR